jgi:hypothetical protein
MEFVSPFEKKIEIVFACDFFVQDVIGGAELSTEALIKSSPYKTYQIRTNQLTKDLLLKNKEKYWVFGNFVNLDFKLIPLIAAELNYSVLEYDYKFCKFRSVEKHEFVEKTECNCKNTTLAELIQLFFCSAKKVWWMSRNQLEFQKSKLPKIFGCNNEILSSIFDIQTLNKIQMLNSTSVDRSKAFIFDSPNWLKGTKNAIEWCEKNNVQFDLIGNIDYDSMLSALRKHQTLVYLPNAKDTCPRMVIEAKLLGCELILNENVQHKDESWFIDYTNHTFDYLTSRTKVFWKSTSSDIGEKI